MAVPLPTPPLNEAARSRVDNFVDSAFAFAVTLLVISTGEPPATVEALKGALLRVPGFAVGFALLAMFWWSHRSYARVRPEGAVPLLISLAVVFVVLVYVYPLRLFSDMFVNFITGKAVAADGPMRSAERMRDLYLIYGAGFTTLAALFVVAFSHAAAAAKASGDAVARGYAGEATAVWTVLILAGGASVVTAALLPFRSAWAVGVPGMCYALIPIGIFLITAFRRPARG